MKPALAEISALSPKARTSEVHAISTYGGAHFSSPHSGKLRQEDLKVEPSDLGSLKLKCYKRAGDVA